MKRYLSILIMMLLLVTLIGCQKEDTSGEETQEPENDVIVVAKVDDQIVSKVQFDKNFAIVENAYKEIYGEDVFSQEFQGKPLGEIIRIEVLNNIVQDILKKRFVQASGATIEAAEVDEAYTKYYDTELKDNPDRQAFFDANGVTEAFIKTQIENQLYAMKFIEMIQAEYDASQSEDPAAFESMVARVRARHILVETLEEATAILERYKAGEDFSELAMSISIDTGSGANGGDLGEFYRGDMVKPFEEAAFSMSVGQVSEPIQTQFGYHIILLDDAQTIASLREAGTTDEEIDAIKQKIADGAVESLYLEKITLLESQAVIEKNETLLK